MTGDELHTILTRQKKVLKKSIEQIAADAGISRTVLYGLFKLDSIKDKDLEYLEMLKAVGVNLEVPGRMEQTSVQSRGPTRDVILDAYEQMSKMVDRLGTMVDGLTENNKVLLEDNKLLKELIEKYESGELAPKGKTG